jgi:MFS family permease
VTDQSLSRASRARASIASFDRRLWVLYGGFVASSMGFAMIVPFVSLYFHEELGVSMTLVGTFFLVTAVVRSSFQGYAGDLSDRAGRIRIMVAGQSARAALFGVMAGAVFLRLGFWWAAGILVLSYVAGAFYQPVASAAVSDLVEPGKRLEAYAMMRVAHNVGWGVGPMLGGLVSEAGYGWLFVLGALTSLVSAWIVKRFVRETHPPAAGMDTRYRDGDASGPAAGAVPIGTPRGRAPEPARRRATWMDVLEIRHDRRFVIFCSLTLLVFITQSQWLATLSVYAADRLGTSTAQLGVVFGINGLMVVVFQLAVTRALRRVTLVGMMILGAGIYALAFFALGFITSYWQLIAGMAGITLAELVVSPASVAMASLIAPPGRTGRYMGIYSLTTSFGWSAGPFLGGVLLDVWEGRPVLLWASISAFALAAAFGFARFRGLYARRA